MRSIPDRAGPQHSLRQLAHSMMDLSLSLETQSNLSKITKERYRRSPRSVGRT